MTVSITIHDENFQRSVSGFEEYLRGTRSVLIIIGRAVRNYTQDTIRLGGRPAYPWAPLSPWTIRRTGHSKPLDGLERLIDYDVRGGAATVFARPTGGPWTVDQHQEGYYTPPRIAKRGAMRIPQGRSSALYFKSVGASVVPGRRIFPTKGEIVEIAQPAVVEWVREGARKVWR